MKEETNVENLEEAYQGVGSFIVEIIKIVALAFVIIVPIRVFLFQPFFVQGASMEPNFEDGQYLIVNEFGFKETNIGLGKKVIKIEPSKTIKRQRTIVFRFPLDADKFFIKRVIGLPGEKIEVGNGQVKIYNSQSPDGFILDEKEYLGRSAKTSGEVTITLKDDEYFVMGDNRLHSSDSRSWGPIGKEDVIGEVLVRAWPLDKISAY